MSTPSVRYLLAIVTTLAMSGCYSGGQWTMPNLAFWKTNPFSTTAKSTAPEAIPRPSELASRPGPAPGSGYAPGSLNTADTLAPAYPSTAAQQPYPATQTATGAPGSSYMAPQQGHYNAGASGTMTASQTPTNPYAVPPSEAPGAPPAAAYSSNPYGASGPHGSAAPFGAGPAPATEPYRNPPGYVAANPSGPYANPVRDDARYSYDARLADYRSTAGAYATPVPDYQSDGGQQSPGYDYRNPPTDYRNQPAGNTAFPPGAQNSHATATPATSHGGNTPQGYYPPPSGYTPGNTGYNPPGVPQYQMPTTSGSTPAGYEYDPGYMPGSVGRYQP